MREAAQLLGVSDDTVRRWAESGRLPTHKDAAGRQVVEGTDLADLARSLADEPSERGVSARNTLPGIVTRVLRDGVMAHVELQAGPHRVVSLMSREAADALGLEPGVLASASVKATNVVVELPAGEAPAPRSPAAGGLRRRRQPTTRGRPPEQRQVVVLAAASLTEVLTSLEEGFEADRPGVDLVLSFGASSTLAQQVVSGAPADVFVSASPATMATVVDAGAADGDPVLVARNRLQLAVPAGNPGGVTGLQDLARPELDVALCAEQVPCGAAAVKALAAAGVVPSVDTFEQDVKAVLAKVRMGEVDAGLVYVTDVLAAGDQVEGIDVRSDPVGYPAVVLADAPQPEDARAFLDLLRSDTGRAALEDAGFEVP